MGRRIAELAGVLVASIFLSFVTGLATTGTDEPVLYLVGALVPLGLLFVYWVWIEPRAEADRVRAARLHRAIDGAFELTRPEEGRVGPRDAARRAFYDRLELSDLFEPNHLEAADALRDAYDPGKALLRRMQAEAEPSDALIAELGAWEDDTAKLVEIARGPADAMTFRQPTGSSAPATGAGRVRGLGMQVQLLELWAGEERRRARERARDRYR